MRVVDYMYEIYKNYIGNADSRTHDYGENARQVVEASRQKVADLLNVEPEEVFFTSGATESNNIAIQGLREYGLETGKNHIITTTIEHKAVLETAKAMKRQGFDVDFIKPEKTGRVNATSVLDSLRDTTLLVSVMHVNNETGVIQPVEEIGEKLKQHNVLFHVDATQSCGKLVEEIIKIKEQMR